MNMFLVESHGNDFYDDWSSTADVFSKLSDARRHANMQAMEDKENLREQDNIRMVGDDTVCEDSNVVYRVSWIRSIPATIENLSKVGRLPEDVPAGGTAWRVIKLKVK